MFVRQLSACLAVFSGAFGAPAVAEQAPLRELTRQDAAAWKWITTALLTPDGKWFAYLASPAWSAADGGDATVVLRGLQGNTEQRYPVGHVAPAGGSLKMSASGRWIAFGIMPTGLELVEVATGEQRRFPAIDGFEFAAGGEREWLVMKGVAAGQGNGSFDLTIQELAQPAAHTLKGATQFAIDPAGHRLAWTGEDGLRVYDFASARERTLDAVPGSTYESLTWSARGTALAAVRRNEAGDALAAFAALDRPRPKTTLLDVRRWNGFPSDGRLAAGLKWRDDEQGVFFGIRPVPPVLRPEGFQGVSNLVVWHWRDADTPYRKAARAPFAPVHWCFVALADRRLVRLSDENIRAEPWARGRSVLGFDVSRYGELNKGETAGGGSRPQIRDYYLIDLDTGQRKALLRGLQVWTSGSFVAPQLSPDGAVVLYRNDAGDYMIYDIRSKTHRNLTAALPTQFYFDENNPKNGRIMLRGGGQGTPLVQGWTRDGAYVLVSDLYDIWALPLKNGQAFSLTGTGRANQVWYQRIVLTEPIGLQILGSTAPVDLTAPIFLKAFDLKSGHEALVRWAPGGGALEELHRDYADTEYYTAAAADVHLYSRETSVDSRDYYRAGPQWQPAQRLTDINPQQRQYRWSPGSRYLTYKNSRGQTRHAILRLPSGYEPGQSYPTIVEIYEQQGGAIHSYKAPFYTPDPKYGWVHNGYAVLQPDVVPRLDAAGPAALDDVTAAVDIAVASGVVDRERLGLFGYSFGAFETNFIVSQTNLFKAAVPFAGMTDFWSGCNGLYGSQRMRKSDICESNQSYFSSPWWEKFAAYLDNSPLYHAKNIRTPLLLIHGDQDTAVPFTQPIELFNTLHRMNKPAVLLQYEGEEHGFKPAASLDMQQRMLEFYGMFLKNQSPPLWWSAGVSIPPG